MPNNAKETMEARDLEVISDGMGGLLHRLGCATDRLCAIADRLYGACPPSPQAEGEVEAVEPASVQKSTYLVNHLNEQLSLLDAQIDRITNI